MELGDVSEIAALAFEGASAVLHEIAVSLGGHDLVRDAERGVANPLMGLGGATECSQSRVASRGGLSESSPGM